MAFHTLKQKLMLHPILQYPYISKEFLLNTDALNDGAGALLSQGEVDKDLHIVFASCVNKAEKTVVQLRMS